jgi:Ca2+-binding EF-hand superfamily protein
MYSNFQSQQIFLNTETGLKRIFQLLLKENPAGINMSQLTQTANFTQSDVPFIQFLAGQFSKIDKDNNATLSEKELSEMIKGFQNNGFTQEQLMHLAAQYNQFGTDKSKELIETVLENFKKVDSNQDGKVSQAEIDNYMLEKEVNEKKDKLNAFKASDISTFYIDTEIKKAEEDATDDF